MENVRNANVAVGTSAVLVSPMVKRGARNAAVFTNTSTGGQVITLSWEKEAVANSGIVLYPAGSWSETKDTAFIPNNREVWAVSSAASGTLAVHERIEE